MGTVEIIIIVISVAVVGGVLSNYIYRKIKHLPTGDCSLCSHNKKKSKLIKMYNKKYKKNIKK